MKHPLHLALLIALAAARSQAPAAQTADYVARLSTVPIDVSMQATIAGSGSVAATLNGNKLTVNGTFTGLKSPATTVQLHNAQKGVRGRLLTGVDLTVSRNTSGTIGGTLTLTPELMSELANGRIYIQLQSERAPEGNLWGWLLPREGRQP
jgi:hypothetical protein